MTLNTNFDDLSDVTDEWIEAAISMLGGFPYTISVMRACSNDFERCCILLARAIQMHPDMITDPVTQKAREICAEVSINGGASGDYLSGKHDNSHAMQAVKRALAGMKMERGK